MPAPKTAHDVTRNKCEASSSAYAWCESVDVAVGSMVISLLAVYMSYIIFGSLSWNLLVAVCSVILPWTNLCVIKRVYYNKRCQNCRNMFVYYFFQWQVIHNTYMQILLSVHNKKLYHSRALCFCFSQVK